jgi:hypothetical protein
MTAGLCQQFLYSEGLLQATSIKTERNPSFNQNDIKRNIPYGVNYYYSTPTCSKTLTAVQINQPNNCNNFSSIYLTFMYSSTCFGRPHAHPQELNNCGSSLWFHRWSVKIAVLSVVVGTAGPTATNSTAITTLQR